AVVDRAGAATAERYGTERGVSAGNGHDIAGVHHRRVAVVAVGIKAPGHVVLAERPHIAAVEDLGHRIAIGNQAVGAVAGAHVDRARVLHQGSFAPRHQTGGTEVAGIDVDIAAVAGNGAAESGGGRHADRKTCIGVGEDVTAASRLDVAVDGEAADAGCAVVRGGGDVATMVNVDVAVEGDGLDAGGILVIGVRGDLAALGAGDDHVAIGGDGHHAVREVPDGGIDDTVRAQRHRRPVVGVRHDAAALVPGPDIDIAVVVHGHRVADGEDAVAIALAGIGEDHAGVVDVDIAVGRNQHAGAIARVQDIGADEARVVHLGIAIGQGSDAFRRVDADGVEVTAV